eukprot:scaffold91703_cov53-Attheya_sp.AAC.4
MLTFSTRDVALLVRELMINFGTTGINTVCILEASDVGCCGRLAFRKASLCAKRIRTRRDRSN